MNYLHEIRKLIAFNRTPQEDTTPVEIRICLRKIPDTLEEFSNHRSVEYSIVNARGELLIGGQGWSLDDAFKEAKQDFFDIIN